MVGGAGLMHLIGAALRGCGARSGVSLAPRWPRCLQEWSGCGIRFRSAALNSRRYPAATSEVRPRWWSCHARHFEQETRDALLRGFYEQQDVFLYPQQLEAGGGPQLPGSVVVARRAPTPLRLRSEQSALKSPPTMRLRSSGSATGSAKRSSTRGTSGGTSDVSGSCTLPSAWSSRNTS